MDEVWDFHWIVKLAWRVEANRQNWEEERAKIIINAKGLIVKLSMQKKVQTEKSVFGNQKNLKFLHEWAILSLWNPDFQGSAALRTPRPQYQVQKDIHSICISFFFSEFNVWQ